jgi:hypothetical protein
MNVKILPEVKEYLNNLVTILYEKEYFGFEEFAINYVNELLDDILTNLSAKLHRPAPEYFDKYGKNLYYACFKKNKHTTWYAFFTKYNKNDDTIYLVRYIANNHTVAQYL